MKNNLKKYLFFFLIVVSLFSVLFIISKVKQNPISSPSATPSVPFQLLKFSPPEGEQKIALDNLAIEFIFSEKIDVSSLTITAAPNIPINFTVNSKEDTVFVYPIDKWLFGQQYTLNLRVRSAEGEDLPSPVNYSFTPQKVTNSNLIEKNLQ